MSTEVTSFAGRPESDVILLGVHTVEVSELKGKMHWEKTVVAVGT